MRTRVPLAGAPVVAAMTLTGALLAAGSGGYGYHRDELYFAMLPPAWFYTDQPGLTPALARLMAGVSDQLWVLRLVPLACLVLTVLIAALLTAELGGSRAAQTLCAFGLGLSAAAMMFGHLLLTSTPDLLLWTTLVLCWVRALRAGPRWWLAVGVVAGVTTLNRWLVAVLLAGLVLGLLVDGPRHHLRSTWLWLGAGLALLIALPGLVFQATHGWPQLAVGGALSRNNSGDVRTEMWLLLVLLLGPPLLPVWVTGLGWLTSGRAGRDVRSLAVVFVLLVAFTYASGAQPHYTLGGLVITFAAGCVPMAEWLAKRRVWRRVAVGLVAVNGLVAVVLGLPVVPLSGLGATPIPGVSQLVADQVGWPTYVDQVAAAYAVATARGGEGTVAVIASNYGEAGAIAKYGPSRGLPQAFSGHNALGLLPPPPEGTSVVVLVGGQLESAASLFDSCEVVDQLDNGVDVDNEEQGQPVALCSGPREPWAQLWPRFRHLD